MTDNGISIQKKSKGNKRNKKSDNQNAKQNQNEKDQMYWVRNDQKADEIVQTNDNDQNFVNNESDQIYLRRDKNSNVVKYCQFAAFLHVTRRIILYKTPKFYYMAPNYTI